MIPFDLIQNSSIHLQCAPPEPVSPLPASTTRATPVSISSSVPYALASCDQTLDEHASDEDPPEAPEDSSHKVFHLEQFQIQVATTHHLQEDQCLFLSAFTIEEDPPPSADSDTKSSSGDDPFGDIDHAISFKHHEFFKHGFIHPNPQKNTNDAPPDDSMDEFLPKEVNDLEKIEELHGLTIIPNDEIQEENPVKMLEEEKVAAAFFDPPSCDLDLESLGKSRNQILEPKCNMTLAELLDESQVVPLFVYRNLEVCDGITNAKINTNDVEVRGKNVGSSIRNVFTAGVKMPCLSFTYKADPTQCLQAVRRNVTDSFDPDPKDDFDPNLKRLAEVVQKFDKFPAGMDDKRMMHPKSSFKAFLVAMKSQPWSDHEMDAIHFLKLILRGTINGIENKIKKLTIDSQMDDLKVDGILELQVVTNEIIHLIEIANVPILTLDIDGLINGWNMKIAELTGLSVDEAIWRHLMTLAEDSSVVVVKKMFFLALQGKEEQDVELEPLIKFSNLEAEGDKWKHPLSSFQIFDPGGLIMMSISR